jgi:hypothetical protein
MGIYVIRRQAILHNKTLSQDLFFYFFMKLFIRLIVQIKGTITYFRPKIINVIEIQVIMRQVHSAI